MSELEEFRKRTEQLRLDNEPHFNFFAMCLACKHKWIATVHYMTSIFDLECPECNSCDSFASEISQEYAAARGADDESIRERHE